MGAALLYEAMAIRGEMDIESYDRLFPAQDYLPRRGFGNLIALHQRSVLRCDCTDLRWRLSLRRRTSSRLS